MGRCPRWEPFKVDPKQKCDPECFNTEKDKSVSHQIATRECSPEWRNVECEDRLGGYNWTIVHCKDIPKCPKVRNSLRASKNVLGQFWSF